MQSLLFFIHVRCCNFEIRQKCYCFYLHFYFFFKCCFTFMFKIFFHMFYFFLELKWVIWKYEMDYQETSGLFVDTPALDCLHMQKSFIHYETKQLGCSIETMFSQRCYLLILKILNWDKSILLISIKFILHCAIPTYKKTI